VPFEGAKLIEVIADVDENRFAIALVQAVVALFSVDVTIEYGLF
jgi:hypothetical protein